MAEQQEIEAMLRRLAAGEVRALARAISLVEDEAPQAERLLAGCADLGRRSRRIGITGAPGAGKSTLVEAMVRLLRGQGERVGVVAFDPSSPLSGGALLGDRIRMQGFSGDSDVYVRSMASRGSQGGVIRQAEPVCRVLEAAGFDTILVETVGVGQEEVGIAALVQVTVLVLVPGMGDGIQSLKAGVMEIADVFCVNKSDQPGAERVESDILAMQGLARDGAGQAGWVPPVVRAIASTGEGVTELLAAVAACLVFQGASGRGE